MLALSGISAAMALPRMAWPGFSTGATVGAAWRGPAKNDPYFAGALLADWQTRRLAIQSAVSLPGRPHEVLSGPGGELLVIAYRFGDWLLRADRSGNIVAQGSLTRSGEERLLNGHAVHAADGTVLYTTETDPGTGLGWIGVRDPVSLKKIAEWRSGGIDPHQIVLDGAGHLFVANGGVPRDPASDRRLDLRGMDSSLAKLDASTGRLLGQWRLKDPRLSLRHLAWNGPAAKSGALLGIALQAEHDDRSARAAAPILATFDGDRLEIPAPASDGTGYAANVAAAHRGGFAVTNSAGIVLLWHPAVPERLARVIEFPEACALTGWPGSDDRGGVLVATALGMVRWHPTDKPLLLAWPKPMALDNHWVLIE